MSKPTYYEESKIDSLSPEELVLFEESLARAIECHNFLDVFYDRFKKSSNEVASLFEHTDMPVLQEKLVKTLTLTALANSEPDRVEQHLQELGTHHQGLSVPQAMYQAWENALISVLHSCDPEFSPELDRIWHQALQVAICKLHQGYKKSD